MQLTRRADSQVMVANAMDLVPARRRWTAGSVVTALVLSVTALSVSFAANSNTAAAAQVACTPDAGYSLCLAFTYSGADQTMTVPAGYDPKNVRTKVWGAGGGGVDYSTMDGGGGGFTTGVLNLTANPSVTVIVGGGGQQACFSSNQVTGSTVPTYGGGGAASTKPPGAGTWYCGASGGGRSAVRVGAGVTNSSAAGEVLTAGGGGGTSDGTVGITEVGGPGGGIAGGPGQCPGTNVNAIGGFKVCSTGFGKGGTQTAGGAAGGTADYTSTFILPTAGSQFQGGSGGCTSSAPGNECGGGGGGGYFGGGGGGEQQDPVDAPGGGGSGHVDGAAVSGGSTTIAPNFNPAGTTQAQYVTGTGVGGGTDNNPANPVGGNGLVVFEFGVRPTITLAKTTLGGVGTFNFTGSNGIAATALTTTAAGVTVVGPAQSLTNGSTATTITEVPAAGFGMTSASACTGMGAGGNATLNLAAGTISLNSAATADGSKITCTFVNAKLPILRIAKTTVGSTGTFTFTGTNGVTATSLTTVTPGTPVTSSPMTLSAASATVVTEAAVAGWTMSSTSACTGLGAGGSAVVNATARTIALDAAATALGSSIVCTFVNQKQPTVTITKISNGGVGTFGFTGNNGYTAQSITTATAGVGKSAATEVLTGPATTTVTEGTVGAGFSFASASCTGLGAGGTQTPTANGVTLDAAATAYGSNIACTFTNVRNAVLSSSKVLTSVNGVPATAGQAVLPGDILKYTLTVTNTSATRFPTATVTDDLSGVLDDATFGTIVAAAGTATRTGNTLTWTGGLAVETTPVLITYTVIVNSPISGDGMLTNQATDVTAGGNCPGAAECSTANPIGAYTVVKTDSAGVDAVVDFGSLLTYTLTIDNTGYFDYPALNVTDNLSDVLDDATYVSGSAGVTVSGNTLTVTDPLPMTDDATHPLIVTYIVKIDARKVGNGKLINVITGGTLGGNCPDVASCRTSNSTPTPPAPLTSAGSLAFTGVDAQLELILAGLVLSCGALLLFAGRRRRAS